MHHNITSRRTGSGARRLRRKQRQRQKRFSIAFQHKQKTDSHSCPNRQLREQSADVDDCFEECQEFGYHLDPDVRVGNLVPEGESSFQNCDVVRLTHTTANTFSILDPEYSARSTPDPIPTPYQDHIIRQPHPHLTELEWCIAKKTYPKLEDVERDCSPEPHGAAKPFTISTKSWWWRTPLQADDLEANSLSVTQSPPSNPQVALPPSAQTSPLSATPSATSVRLQGIFHIDNPSALPSRPAKKRKLNDEQPPSLLTGYRIPSPLLYHEPRKDVLPEINDVGENNCFCLGPSFEHYNTEHKGLFNLVNNGDTCAVPESDPVSEVAQNLLQKRSGFVAASLPQMGVVTPTSPVGQAMHAGNVGFYTNTRPYLPAHMPAAPSQIDTGICMPVNVEPVSTLTEAEDLASHIYVAPDLRSNDTILRTMRGASRPTSMASKHIAAVQSKQASRNTNLIFPRLPTTARFRNESLDRYFERTNNLWSKQQDEQPKSIVDPTALNNDTVDYIEDHKSKLQELWEAYEEAILRPIKAELCASNRDFFLSEAIRFPIIGIPGPQRGRTLWPVPLSPTKPSPVDHRVFKKTNIAPCSLSTCPQLMPANARPLIYTSSMRKWNSDIWNLEQRPLPTTDAIVKQTQEAKYQSKIDEAFDRAAKVLDLGQLFYNDPEDENVEAIWPHSGWDGHLLYPKDEPCSPPMLSLSLCEGAELDDGSYVCYTEGSGTQINEDSDEDNWFDWDDDADGLSESIEEEFFEL